MNSALKSTSAMSQRIVVMLAALLLMPGARLLAQGTTFFWRTRHLVLVPGLGIALLVLGCNLLGDGLRDYVDPKRSRAR